MDNHKNEVEVILFTTGRFMDIDEISQLSSIASKGLVKSLLHKLKEDYELRNSALILLEENNKWKLSIKREYNYLTTKLLDSTEFDKPTQETLAIIAYKQPILQSEVIKMRGNTAYDHIKFLRENEFITAEKSGRTRLLKLAPKFFDYFDIVEKNLKEQFVSAENLEQEMSSVIQSKEKELTQNNLESQKK